MKIKLIRFKNFKGSSGSQELTGVDFFIGRNGSGKTTRLQAVALSMVGYIPGKGKKAESVFRFATGDSMAAGLTMENGFSFDRTFEKTTKVNKKQGTSTTSIGESVTVSPGKGEKTDTQKKGRIQEEIGSFPVMLDIDEFLTLSDSKRRDFMYSLSPITTSEWTEEKIAGYLLTELAPPELETNNKELFIVTVDAIKEALEQFPDGYAVSDGLQAMIDWTAIQLSYWKGKEKDSQGAVRQLSDLKNQQEATDRDIVAEKAELDDLNKKLIEAEKKLSQHSERKELYNKKLKKMQELQDQLKAIQEQDADAEAPPDYKALIEQANAEIKMGPDITEAVAEKGKEITSHKTILDRFLAEKNDMEVSRRVILANVQSLREAYSQVENMQGACVIHKDVLCPKDFTGFDGFIQAKEDEAADAVSKLDEQIKILQSGIDKGTEEIKTIRTDIEALKESVNKAKEHNNRVAEKVNALTKSMNDYENGMKRQADRKELLQNELKALQDEPALELEDLALLERQIYGIRARIAELKPSVETKETAKQNLITLQKSLMDNRVSDYKATAFADIAKALGPKGIQGEMVKEILEPLKEEIKANLVLMGKDDVTPYFETESDTGQEIFQFGWFNEKKHQVNFDVLSTGEQLVFLAALLTTIIDRAQPKIKALIIDNVNHLDAVNFQLVLDGVAKLKGKLDNIILAGAVPYDIYSDEWKVWDLSPVIDTGYGIREACESVDTVVAANA